MEILTTRNATISGLSSLERPLTMLLAVVAFGLLVMATHQGIGTSPDSAAYIGAAENFIKGSGLSVPFGETIHDPLVQFPPLYSLLLSLSGIFGLHPLDGARWLQALLFASNVLLVVIATHQFTRPGSWAPIFSGLLFVFSPGLLQLHAMAWSEALFLAFCLASLICQSVFLKHKRIRMLAAAAILASMASVTRYAGVALIAAGVIGIFFVSRAQMMNRLTYSLAYISTALIPIIIWGVRNYYFAGSPTNRTLAFHPFGAQQITQVLDTFARWFQLSGGNTWIRIAAFLIASFLSALIIWTLRQSFSAVQSRPTVSPMPWLLAIFAVVYPAFLVLSYTFVDANIPLDERILSPLYLTFLLLTVFALDQASARGKQYSLLIGVFLLFFVASSAWTTVGIVRALYATGSGITSTHLVDRSFVQAIQSLPETQSIYSNAPEVVYLQTGRATLRLPKKVILTSNQVNENYQIELREVKNRLIEEKGSLIFINWVRGKTLASEIELVQQLNLQPMKESRVGTIYAVSIGGQ